MKALSAAAVAGVITLPAYFLPSAAYSSVVFNLEKETITVRNDGNGSVGVLVGSCRTESHLLWMDRKMELPWGANPPASTSETYGLEETGFGPAMTAVIARLDRWRKLSISEKVKSADPRDRAALGRELREACPPPSAPSASQPSPQVDANGCTDGRRMMYVTQRTGFLGLGGKKDVPIGCMTQEELNRWNIEQQNSRPTYQPPTYQPRNCTSRVIGSQVYTNCY
jgi:hypothetical protein